MTQHSTAPTLVVVAHGSRDPRALRTIMALLDRVRELRPGVDVRLGHIEIDRPRLSETLDALATGGAGRAVLVPLLLGRGVHIKRDLPAAAARVPGLGIRIAAPLGPHPLLTEALYGRLVEAGRRANHAAGGVAGDGFGGGTRRGTGVVLAAAGSRDPESAADTRRSAGLLSERLGGVPVLPGYASAAGPTVPQALRALAAQGCHRIAIASYFTAPGHFATSSVLAVQRTSGLRTSVAPAAMSVTSPSPTARPLIVAAPLGAHPAMARLLLQRYDETVSASDERHGERPGERPDEWSAPYATRARPSA